VNPRNFKARVRLSGIKGHDVFIEKTVPSQQTSNRQLVREVRSQLEVVSANMQADFMGKQIHLSAANDSAGGAMFPARKIIDPKSSRNVPMEQTISRTRID